MANNPVVNSLTFTGAVAGAASIQAQGIAGGITLLLPNIPPVQGQLLTAATVNGNNVFLGWVSPQSGSGSVTSVALAAPASILSVSGSPITGVGTLTLSLATQSANTIWAGPVSGGAAAPSFRVVGLNELSGNRVGNGNAYQLTSTGQSITSGHIVTYDTNGNTQDSGKALTSIATIFAAGGNTPPASNNHIVTGTSGLTSGSVIVTLAGSAVFADENYVITLAYFGAPGGTPPANLYTTIQSNTQFTIHSTDATDNTSQIMFTVVGFGVPA